AGDRRAVPVLALLVLLARAIGRLEERAVVAVAGILGLADALRGHGELDELRPAAARQTALAQNLRVLPVVGGERRHESDVAAVRVDDVEAATGGSGRSRRPGRPAQPEGVERSGVELLLARLARVADEQPAAASLAELGGVSVRGDAGG